MTVLLNESGEKAYKVMVAVPCGEMVHADFAYDMARLVGYSQLVRPEMTMLLYHVKGTYLPRARARLVQEALDQSCSHILWLDSDMRFPKDTLLRLLAHEKPVVAANYSTRQPPYLPTAYDLSNQPIFDDAGLIEARHCGMGVMLVDCDVFREMSKPWFALGYAKAIDDYSGEDTYFCERVRQTGATVLIDGPLSEQVSHCGGFTFDMSHTRMTREAATHGT
jgi:hypothetical protein